MPQSTWDRYGAYLEAPPEQVFEWTDPETGAEGWLVINSLRGGAAGGGTRMRDGVTREEVTYLAKAMQLKFAFSGPHIGGGKSGICFDPNDPRKGDVLRRWYAAIRPFLTSRYGTGGDVNVDEQREVVPMCAEIGIVHPQEGIVRGHMGLSSSELPSVFSSLGDGIKQAVPACLGVEGVELSVSDLITGYGVASATRRLYERRGESLEGVRVIVEGFGNVGASACLYLTRMGARIVGIADKNNGLVSEAGLDVAAVEDLIRRREVRTLPDHPDLVPEGERELAYHADADLFVPAAISGSVDARRIGQLARHGVSTVVCGANQPFREVHLGETLTAQAADREFEVVPAIVASLGMARCFHHLMDHRDGQTAEQIFASVDAAMDASVDAVLDRVGDARRGLISAALEIALERGEEG
jgi:glutamate dehydrogenase (NAD(P)+)